MGFFGVKKRHPYPSGQRSYGAKAIIDFDIVSNLEFRISNLKAAQFGAQELDLDFRILADKDIKNGQSGLQGS
jgi:hypothetical protein